MKKVLIIGQFTDLSGYGNVARCYLDNLIELEEEGLIELSILNSSFENKVYISHEQQEKIKKRSLTKRIDYKHGLQYEYDPEDKKRIEQYISKKDYEIVFCHTSNLLEWGELNDNAFLLASISPTEDAEIFNYYQICSNARSVHQAIVWETESIPDSWRKALANKNLNIKNLLCACDWNTDIFSELGINTLTIPYVIDYELGHNEEYYQKILSNTKDHFVFSSVFQWSPRKGSDILIKSFITEFVDNEDVCLILKTYASAIKEVKDELKYLKTAINNIITSLFNYGEQIKPKCKLVIINQLLDKKEVNSIYKASNAFVLPSRGEGFCLPAVESLNYEKPVIMPDKGGHIGFIAPDDPFLIESTMDYCHEISDPLWSSIDTTWVESSVKSLREKMRLAYSNKTHTKQIGKNQAKYMRNYLTKDKCVKLFKEALL